MGLEFRISDNFKLKLAANNEIHIYAGDRIFRQDKYLLKSVQTDKMNRQALDKSSEMNALTEKEFLEYCSNFKKWYENDDNTQLHKNIRFQLLKELSKYGSHARERFEEEMAVRLGPEYEPAMDYSKNKVLLELLELPDASFAGIKEINLSFMNLSEIPEQIYKLKDLEILKLYNNNLEEIPEKIFELKNLRVLDLGRNKIREIPEIFKNNKLSIVNLEGNPLRLKYFRTKYLKKKSESLKYCSL
ncbi:hypothetical protein COX58_01330 [archaeon CG_4_10_14_0_2_um_filter_Archaea_38_6]|nr:MAG: hypothetical protein COS83_03990 [archaeon CG07_land_8_20_14_0_80_38_8]PIX43271.1 MAG: hypothetical protein COZ55_01385 [archaeon CG_4_8_14_3_um_filter_38_5]PJA22737.1 MAG: hypothetical protein COX58_01330 [archaeon CG_4_10_14_0_2_um_filter_Archaea_38_6]